MQLSATSHAGYGSGQDQSIERHTPAASARSVIFLVACATIVVFSSFIAHAKEAARRISASVSLSMVRKVSAVIRVRRWANASRALVLLSPESLGIARASPKVNTVPLLLLYSVNSWSR